MPQGHVQAPSDRYATASELVDDLLHWQQGPQQGPKPVAIVPRGLRSFGPEDADFFLDLLPGSRGRDGLPESIRFWKTRIEESDPDKTFDVGLIYGPSGCGKSSLVKAGLLPQLSKSSSRPMSKQRRRKPKPGSCVDFARGCRSCREIWDWSRPSPTCGGVVVRPAVTRW